MNDFFLFLGILIFFFVLWLYNGGPNNPISFSGPYITPVTNVNTIQEGYGEGISANDIRAREKQSFWGSVFSGSKGQSEIPAADRSTFSGSVRIQGGNQGAEEARTEHITIRSTSNTDVDITGWQLVSTKTGAHATIPKGVALANYGSRASDIILHSGDEAIITTGKSPIEESFRETICTGYLDVNNKYSPGLNSRCPSPVDELEQFYAGNAPKYDECLSYVQSLRSCRVPDKDAPGKTASSCQNFVDNRMSYKGCVSGHRNDTDFYSSTWRVFLEQSKQLWRRTGDTIRLLDTNGKVVDQYSY